MPATTHVPSPTIASARYRSSAYTRARIVRLRRGGPDGAQQLRSAGHESVTGGESRYHFDLTPVRIRAEGDRPAPEAISGGLHKHVGGGPLTHDRGLRDHDRAPQGADDPDRGKHVRLESQARIGEHDADLHGVGHRVYGARNGR